MDNFDKLPTLSIRNVASSPAPPFALLRITGQDEDGTFTVNQPNADSQWPLIVNGPWAVAASGYGTAYNFFPSLVFFETEDGTPAIGEEWGAKASSWKAHKNYTGLKVTGATEGNFVCMWPNVRTTATSDGINVGEADGSPLYASVTDFRALQSTGLKFTQPGGAGTAQLESTAATASAWGVVSTTTQQFAGDKQLLGETTIGAYPAIPSALNVIGLVNAYDVLNASGLDTSDGYTYHQPSPSADYDLPVAVYMDAFLTSPGQLGGINHGDRVWVGVADVNEGSGANPMVIWQFLASATFMTLNYDGVLSLKSASGAGAHLVIDGETGLTATVGGLSFKGGAYIGGTLDLGGIADGTYP